MRAGGIQTAQNRQIDLGGDEHEEVGQQIAAAGDTQGGRAVEDDVRVIAVGVLQIDVFISGIAQAAVNCEGAEIVCCRGSNLAQEQGPGFTYVGCEAADNPIGAA